MVELLSSAELDAGTSAEKLIKGNEVIVIVDDSPEISILLQAYLKNRHLSSRPAHTANELFQLLREEEVALVLLDIGLPDRDGDEILAELVRNFPDLGIIMVTGSTDLQTALRCLRLGADDYLTKPVNIEQFHATVNKTLRKRRLAIDNRLFHQELQLTNLRTQFLHHLNLKMNSAYLNARELKGVLQTILIGITSEEGLRFNRAFLALFDEQETMLQGELAIGPGSREDAAEVWNEIKRKNLRLQDLFHTVSAESFKKDTIVNEIARSLVVPASFVQHPLIHACRSRSSILVSQGQAAIEIPSELIETLGEDTFVIVPLFSPSKALGVIIADNFVTRQPINQVDVEALETFAGQASLAVEHSRLYTDMQQKIDELELVTQELEKSKDLLIEAERYSALGYMSAQLMHALRNPITSIGGTARLLSKRITDQENRKFLDVLTRETSKLEATLNDLFSFVSKSELKKTAQHLHPLIRRSVMIFYGAMKKSGISYEIELTGEDPVLFIDSDKIRQVLLHLIKNSIEAMPDGGVLQVHSWQEDGSALVSIRDSGVGISVGELSRVTDPFYTTKTYGTGMGLTLVEQILAQHDADFSLTPVKPHGMTALIRFRPTASPSEPD
ncbi:response regulator [Desulfofustis glycolicus]|uniref:histidine kinase n=1 Tax=Desulfofustis glycolicus DSM 9705 TaxID=1121409 RepID=A0A1M5X6X3_9BACT|nr:response regulator [Desulfofustis glycolicus]MCB2216037.1 response regulator [Desulfobulbaceae bacterium]SHH95328.1 GAF domain-containing protein [Desulfofustis glycolicus DSM 9705]